MRLQRGSSSVVALGALLLSATLLPMNAAAAARPMVGSSPRAPVWSTAQQVLGLDVFAPDGAPSGTPAACPAAGECVIVGTEIDASGDTYGFVLQQHEASWGAPFVLPAGSGFDALSCPQPGSCTAAGYDADGAMVLDEQDGRWGAPMTVEGLSTDAVATNLACSSVRKCNVIGGFVPPSGVPPTGYPFATTSKGLGLSTARRVPGLGANAEITTVACPSLGNCTAGGVLTTDGSGNSQGFVLSKVEGRWQRAQLVPGLKRLNTDAFAWVSAVACGSTGNCSVVGSYTRVTASFVSNEPFIADQVNGRWGRAHMVEVGAVFSGAGAGLSDVTCLRAGYCTATGTKYNLQGQGVGFVVNQVRGVWQRPGFVSGVARDFLNGVACAGPGTCVTGGSFYVGVGSATARQAFAVSEVDGHLEPGTEIPGVAPLNTAGAAAVTNVACARSGYCLAVGVYASGDVGSPPDESPSTGLFVTTSTIG